MSFEKDTKELPTSNKKGYKLFAYLLIHDLEMKKEEMKKEENI
jgi:hypothetical protein